VIGLRGLSIFRCDFTKPVEPLRLVSAGSLGSILRTVFILRTGAVSGRGNLQDHGFLILPGVFGPREIETLIGTVSRVGDKDGVCSRRGKYAIRNLLQLAPEIAGLANSTKLRQIVERHLGHAADPVRGTLFDKTPAANWLVPWHQDLTISVMARLDVPGYGPWTMKAGGCHVQPPVSILQNMLSVRIHLDDCMESNGALRVLPGTHGLGRLSAAQIAEQQSSVAPICCIAHKGDVVLMKPLLLHASSAATEAAHRRVIHIDYASSPLDGGLQWPVTAGA